MGFEEDYASSALVRYRNNLDNAMNFLLMGGQIETVEEA